MRTTISSKGQVVLPAQLRERDAIKPGEEFEVTRLSRGRYRLTRVTSKKRKGVVDWLLKCPDKEYFVPIESESTDTL